MEYGVLGDKKLMPSADNEYGPRHKDMGGTHGVWRIL
jgi:hypothetical protein